MRIRINQTEVNILHNHKLVNFAKLRGKKKEQSEGSSKQHWLCGKQVSDRTKRVGRQCSTAISTNGSMYKAWAFHQPTQGKRDKGKSPARRTIPNGEHIGRWLSAKTSDSRVSSEDGWSEASNELASSSCASDKSYTKCRVSHPELLRIRQMLAVSVWLCLVGFDREVH